MPQVGHSYYVGHPSPQYGVRVWYDGQLWIYRYSGIDSYPAGTVQVGDTLKVAYESTTPTRKYYINSTLMSTDTTSVVNPALNDIQAFCNTTGDYIGDIAWTVTYSGCTPDYVVQPVGQSGGSVVIGTPGSGSAQPFSVLYYQVNEIPDLNLEVEVNS
jgi:hypothetical protein